MTDVLTPQHPSTGLGARFGSKLAYRLELSSIEQEARETIATVLYDAPEEMQRFFATLFGPTPYMTGMDLARDLAVGNSTITTRFYRHRLPTPKAYVAGATLVRVAKLLEVPTRSFNQVASMLDASSPQSLGRSIRIATGLSSSHIRATYTGQSMLAKFVADLVIPHRDRLRYLRPLTGNTLRDRAALRVAEPPRPSQYHYVQNA